MQILNKYRQNHPKKKMASEGLWAQQEGAFQGALLPGCQARQETTYEY
jgi:hypothetical protein